MEVITFYHPNLNYNNQVFWPNSTINHKSALAFVVIRFRCLKYWLKGEMKGKTEIFIDNLPGAPDNINLAPDGSFWIALIEVCTINTLSKLDMHHGFC